MLQRQGFLMCLSCTVLELLVMRMGTDALAFNSALLTLSRTGQHGRQRWHAPYKATQASKQSGDDTSRISRETQALQISMQRKARDDRATWVRREDIARMIVRTSLRTRSVVTSSNISSSLMATTVPCTCMHK